jgi:hypothetical protein
MAPRTNYRNLSDGLHPLALLDNSLADMGKLGVLPCTATGTNTIVLAQTAASFAPTITAYADNLLFQFVPANSSTSAVTIQVGVLAALPLYDSASVAITNSGDLQSGVLYVVAYRTSLNSGLGGFQVVSPSVTSASAYSVLGRSGSTAGRATSIAAADNTVLSRSGGTLAFVPDSKFLKAANNGSDFADPATAFDNLSPITTRGDLIAGGVTHDQRIALGASGYALLSNGTDPSWVGFTPTSGGTARSWLTKGRDWINASDYASINAAVTAIGSTVATLVVSSAQTLTANLSIPSTLELMVVKGGSIVKASTYTVTIAGPFSAGPYQVFSGFSAGNVVFSNAIAALAIYPEWFGAVGDFTTNDQTALDCAFGATTGGTGQYVFLSKLYGCGDGQFFVKTGNGIIGANPTYTGLYARGITTNVNIVNFAGVAGTPLNGCFARHFAIISDVGVSGRAGLYCAFLVNFIAEDLVVENCTTQVFYSGVGSSTFRRVQAGMTLNPGVGTLYGFRGDGTNQNASIKFFDCNAFSNYAFINGGGTYYGHYFSGGTLRDCKWVDFESAICSYGHWIQSSGQLDTDIAIINNLHDSYFVAGEHIEGIGTNGSVVISGGSRVPAEPLSTTYSIDVLNSFNVTISDISVSTYNRQWATHYGVRFTNVKSSTVNGCHIDRCIYGIYDTGGSDNAIVGNSVTAFPLTQTVTITIASPGVVSFTGCPFVADQPIVFATFGTLPTGLTAGTTYYVKALGAADALGVVNSFTVTASPGGAVINTSGSQSGVHNCRGAIPTATAFIYSNSSRGTITGNTLSGYATTGVSLAASSSSVVVSGNSINATNITSRISNSGTGNLIWDTAWTTYAPSVTAGSGAFGASPPTATGQYVDAGPLRNYDITVTFQAASSVGTAATYIGVSVPTAPAAAMDNGMGRETGVTGSALQALGFVGNTVVRITKLSDSSFIGGNSYVLHIQFATRNI